MAMPYKKTIDAPWVIEVIAESFDGALELMTEGSLIYGGAVRDALAEMPLEGDLDIAVSRNNSGTQKRMFSESLKWKEASLNKKASLSQKTMKYEGDLYHRPITASSAEQLGFTFLTTSKAQTIGLNRIYRNTAGDASALFSVQIAPKKYIYVEDANVRLVRDLNGVFYHDPTGKVSNALHGNPSDEGNSTPNWGNPYDKYKKKNNHYGKNVPMSAVSNFEGIGGIKAQVIVAKSAGGRRDKHVFNKDEEVFRVVREVDMICCGVAMNTEGEVFELVEGAHEDCQKKILRVNPVVLTSKLEIPILEERIKRFTDRGWESKVDLKLLSGKVKKMKSSAEKKAKVKFERQQARMSAKKKKRDKATGKESLVDFSKHVLDELFEKKTKEENWHMYVMSDEDLMSTQGSGDIKRLLDIVNKKLPGCIKKVVSKRPVGTNGETHFYVENNRLDALDKKYIFGGSYNRLIYLGIADTAPEPKPKQYKTNAYVRQAKAYSSNWKSTKSNMPTKRIKIKTQGKKQLVTNYSSSLSRAEIINHWGGLDAAFEIIRNRVNDLGIPSLQAIKQEQSGRISITCAGTADIRLLDRLRERPSVGELRSGSRQSGVDIDMLRPPAKPSVYVETTDETEIPSGRDLYTSYNHVYTPGDIRRSFNDSRELCLSVTTKRCTPYGINATFESIPGGGIMCKLNRKRAFDSRTLDDIFDARPYQIKIRAEDDDEEGPATLARQRSWTAGNELRVKSRVTGRTSSSYSNLEHTDTVKEMHKATLKAKYGDVLKTNFTEIENKIMSKKNWYGEKDLSEGNTKKAKGLTYVEHTLNQRLIEDWGGLSAFVKGVTAISRNNGITFNLESTGSNGTDVSFERAELPMSNSLIRQILLPPNKNIKAKNKTMKINSNTED